MEYNKTTWNTNIDIIFTTQKKHIANQIMVYKKNFQFGCEFSSCITFIFPKLIYIHIIY